MFVCLCACVENANTAQERVSMEIPKAHMWSSFVDIRLFCRYTGLFCGHMGSFADIWALLRTYGLFGGYMGTFAGI